MLINNKKTLLAGALVASLAATAQAGLVHRYNFNTDAKDSVGTANATLMGGANATISPLDSGNGTGAFLMNLTPASARIPSSDTNGAYVVLPAAAMANIKSVTLESWTDLGNTGAGVTAGNWSRIFDFGDPVSASPQGRNYIMMTPHSGNTTPDTRMEFNLNQTGNIVSTNGTLEGYHHVACVFDCTNSYMELYIDGELKGHLTTTYQITNVAKQAYWLGRSLWGTDEYLYGFIDEFRIYDRPLGAPEIKANFIAGANTPNPGLSALGTFAAITMSDPGTIVEKFSTNIAVTGDFANATGLSLFSTPNFTLVSSAPSIASITGGGFIKGIKPGKATITATYGGKTVSMDVTVSADTSKPAITSASTMGYDRVLDLAFTKELDSATAQNVANFVLDGGAITVNRAVLMTNNNTVTVRLFTAPFDPNAEHAAVVNNILDTDFTPNTIATDTTVKFGFTAGAPLVYRLYYNNQGFKSDTLANGMTNPGYPYTGGTSIMLPNGLTDGGGRGDNYFSVINGWLLPPTSGNYTFYVATDDESTLWVSSDDKAANLPASPTLNCTGYATAKGYISGGTPPTRTGNSNVVLQAGNKYYFRLIHRNGTGGDQLDVAWQMPGAPAVANNDPAIAAQYIVPQIETNVVLAISSQPTNQTILQSRSVTLSAKVVGVPTYTSAQWYKDGKPVANATALTYTIANAALTNSGTYYLIISNLAYTVQSSSAVLTVSADTVKPTITSATTRLGNNVYVQFSEVVDPTTATNINNYKISGETITSATLDPNGSLVILAVTPKLSSAFGVVVSNVKDLAGNVIVANSGGNGQVLGVTPGMISYWPLDTVVGTKTPDVVSGYDMTLVNLSSADLVAGKSGNAFQFANSRKTFLTHLCGSSENLPIDKFPAFTVSLWVNASPNVGDLRIYSESSTANNQPLWDIGSNPSSSKVDIFSRNDSGTASINHVLSGGTAFDNTWHHIVWIQNSNTSPATARLYVDGVLDSTSYAAPAYPLTDNVTSIGGVRRASDSAWFTGMIDDVAVWNRVLDAEEVMELYTHGTPVPPPIPQPLTINSFKSDLAAVAVGDTTTLRWDVTKDATKVVIDPVGDVTASTVAGAGTVQVTVSKATTYALTVTRGVETVSQQLNVGAIGGVAEGWALLDNFDRYDVGSLKAPWVTPVNTTVVDVNGNRMVNVSSGACGLPLNALTVPEGNQTTLFCRFYLAQDESANSIDEMVGLTDKALRWYSDYVNDMGPCVVMTNSSGPLEIATQNGYGSTLETASTTFASQTVYNLWIDIQNDTIANGDLMSVYVAPDGDENRTLLFSEYRSNRNPAANDPVLGSTASNLVYVIVGGNSGSSVVYFDDFYISKSGYNSTVPHAYGFTPLFTGEFPKLSASMSANGVVISWSKDLGAGYTLQSASSITGTWSDVGLGQVDSGTNTTVTVPSPGNPQFFRLKK